jgi:hypothetical protein
MFAKLNRFIKFTGNSVNPEICFYSRPPQRIEELVDSFIEAQDVKLSSKLLYRRTLRQYFNWVEKRATSSLR